MFRIAAFSIAALLTSGAGALAQQTVPHLRAPETLTHLTAAEIQARLTKARPEATVASAVVSDHEAYYIQYISRTGLGDPEQHAWWDDHIHAISGSGTVTYGGTYEGGKATNAGEPRGGRIIGGTTITLQAGEYLLIPAGVPHQISPIGAKFDFVVFKARH